MKACEWCGAEFKPRRSKQKFCSKACGDYGRWLYRDNPGRVEVTCGWCGEKFTAQRTRARKYCSLRCASTATAPRGRGPARPNWAGGLVTGQGGRRYIVCRDGSRVAYYRAVMEAELGRRLESGEVVHHKNGDPTDDTAENLEVLPLAEHARLHAVAQPRKNGRWG